MNEVVKEKLFQRCENSFFTYEEGQLNTYNKLDSISSSYRIYKDGLVGIYCCQGEIEDEKGYHRAFEKLSQEKKYPFKLETGVRYRDKTEKEVPDSELKALAEECMDYLRSNYPQFIFSATFEANKTTNIMTNDLGLNYTNIDSAVNADVRFKHIKSTDIVDGGFHLGLRNFDKNVFFKMADDYLKNYENIVELPEELIYDTQYYGIANMLISQLNAEQLALGTSLLSGKVGQKIFSTDFTLFHDVSDDECWFNTFWDGEGYVTENDKRVLVDHGTIITGISDKRTAAKYNVPYTGNAYINFGDLTGTGFCNPRLARSEKKIKELLNGRYAFVILLSESSYNERGEVTISVQNSLLTDGENILGRLKPFTFTTNIYDAFGKDYIGVGADKPIFNDKQVLVRVYKA